jgi:hypothetical protein
VAGLAAFAPSGHIGLQAQSPQANDVPPTGVIAGRVVDGLSAAPVSGATLTLSAPGSQSWPRGGLQGKTDDGGRFEFSGLPAGSFTISVRAEGYPLGSYYGALWPGDGIGNRIVLQPAEKLTDLPIRIWPNGSISGTVTDERGEAVVGLQVRFLSRWYIGGRSFWSPSSPTKTDDRGRFTRELRSGDYLVLLPAEPPSLASSAVSHEGVFYGGGRTTATASVITLGPGERREGVDLVTTFAARSKLLSVSGIVTAPESVRLLGYVGLVRRDAEDPVADLKGFRAWIRQDGKVSFSHVPPGDYRLRFAVFPTATDGASTRGWMLRTTGRPASLSEAMTWFADMPLSLTKSVNDLVVPLQPGSRIAGRVVFDGRSDLPSADILNTVLMHVVHGDDREFPTIPTGAVDPQGRFQTAGLPPGKYVLDPYAYIDNTRHVVSSVRIGEREFLGQGLDVSTTNLTDVVVTLSNRTWDLSGTVRDQAGRPVPEARVIVFPRDRTRWQTVGFDSAGQVAQVAADRAGMFSTTGARGGDYLAAAVAVPPQYWMAPEHLETLVPHATPVRLEVGEKRTVELRLR